MKDLNDQESRLYQHIVNVASGVAKRYGYTFFETPMLEETALFKRSVGESSDIVGKEMYQFIDKGGHDVCLRPEGTAGVVRAFIQEKLDRRGGISRFFYYGPMFRYERPQKGRLRQFHQFGCESFGEANVLEDFHMILMIKDILDALGIAYDIKLNSLGCPECMPPYRDTLVARLWDIKDSLCEDCRRRITTNPIRVLDCKIESCQTLLADAPVIVENLCATCNRDFETLTSLLREHGIDFEIDSHLVRGLDYYSKTAFEFVSPDIGAQSSIAGGGRYDRLVEFLGGKPTSAIGFALGIERLMPLVELPESPREGYYLGFMCEGAQNALNRIAHRLRKNHTVHVGYERRSLKAHLKTADKLGVRYCAIIGEEELAAQTLWIKDLQTKEEQKLAFEQLG